MPRTSPTPEEVAAQLTQIVSVLRRRVRAAAIDETIAYPLFSMLKRLELEGPATTADLARAETITPQTAGSMVAKLEGEALVTRKDDARDGRRRLVLLTAAGRKVLAEGRARGQGWLTQQMSERLEPTELRDLAAAVPILRKLVEI